MAQGTPDLDQYFPAGLRILEHRPADGGESEREQARALLSGPQARISRLRDLADLDEPSRAEPAGAAGRTRKPGRRPERDGCGRPRHRRSQRPHRRDRGRTGTVPLKNGHDLAESDLDNLTAVLGHEVAPNTMKNYRVQWNNFVNWAAAKGIRSLPADPRHVAAYLAERIEEHGHKARDAAGGGGGHSIHPQVRRAGRSPMPARRSSERSGAQRARPAGARSRLRRSRMRL